MGIKEIPIPVSNRLVEKFIQQDEAIAHYFDYVGLEQKNFQHKYNELMNRTFPRSELADYLLHYHSRFNTGVKTVENIQKLREHHTVAVVGGQQAGLLTGPLYTIHKILSILTLAKQQQEKLQQPVVPVFWVAGEDHDFDEINHLFVGAGGKPIKIKLQERMLKKDSITYMPFHRDKCLQWAQAVFKHFGETEHTSRLLQKVEQCIEASSSYVEFFVHIIYMLFPDSGLIVIDAGDPSLRKIEIPFFKQIVMKNEQLIHDVFHTQLQLKEEGYGEPIEISDRISHLFIRDNGERILLEKDDKGHYVSKKGGLTLTKDELLRCIEKTPERISNNVVTRPLMQDYLFPTLAFIAGPGEIAYWATLRKAFHLFGFSMPLLAPRINITFIEEKMARFLQKKNISLTHALQYGIQAEKEQWLKAQDVHNTKEHFDRAKEELEKLHLPLRNLTVAVDPGLKDLANKNKALLENQLQFLQRKIEQSICFQHEVELNKYDQIDFFLRPLGAPQERVLNIFELLNKYGEDFLARFTSIDYQFNGYHKVICIP